MSDERGGSLEEIKERRGVVKTPAKFDKGMLTPAQRKAWEIAQAQGVKPVTNIEELFVLDLLPAEAKAQHEFLVETRRTSRAEPPKRLFD